MSRISEKEWIEDFQDFVGSRGAQVPENISNAILSRVYRDLNPSPWLVFLKLFGIHSIVGTLSLAICDQFGMSPFRTGFSLSDYFMTFGHSACMVLCGVLFITFSIATARIVLRPEDWRVLGCNSFIQVFGLSAVSLGIFAVFGAEITLGLGLLWLLGAMFGGLAASKIFARHPLKMLHQP